MKSRPRTSAGKCAAFTLVEVLVVIGVIIIIVSITLPAVSAAKKLAAKARSAHDIQALSMGLDAYNQALGYYPVIYVKADASGLEFVSDGNDSDSFGNELYNSLFAVVSGADGAQYGPFLNASAFTIVGTEVRDHNSNHLVYISANLPVPNLAAYAPVWDPLANQFLTDSSGNPAPCGTFVEYEGLPLYRAPTMIHDSNPSPWQPNSIYWYQGTKANSIEADFPLWQMRYILGNRWSGGPNTGGQALTPNNGTAGIGDGRCDPARGETPAYTGPYILWAPSPSGAFGLVTTSSSSTNLLGSSPACSGSTITCNGTYTTDDTFNFTFQP